MSTSSNYGSLKSFDDRYDTESTMNVAHGKTNTAPRRKWIGLVALLAVVGFFVLAVSSLNGNSSKTLASSLELDAEEVKQQVVKVPVVDSNVVDKKLIVTSTNTPTRFPTGGYVPTDGPTEAPTESPVEVSSDPVKPRSDKSATTGENVNIPPAEDHSKADNVRHIASATNTPTRFPTGGFVPTDAPTFSPTESPVDANDKIAHRGDKSSTNVDIHPENDKSKARTKQIASATNTPTRFPTGGYVPTDGPTEAPTEAPVEYTETLIRRSDKSSTTDSNVNAPQPVDQHSEKDNEHIASATNTPTRFPTGGYVPTDSPTETSEDNRVVRGAKSSSPTYDSVKAKERQAKKIASATNTPTRFPTGGYVPTDGPTEAPTEAPVETTDAVVQRSDKSSTSSSDINVPPLVNV